jgi:hypothetical protein
MKAILQKSVLSLCMIAGLGTGLMSTAPAKADGIAPYVFAAAAGATGLWFANKVADVVKKRGEAYANTVVDASIWPLTLGSGAVAGYWYGTGQFPSLPALRWGQSTVSTTTVSTSSGLGSAVCGLAAVGALCYIIEKKWPKR